MDISSILALTGSIGQAAGGVADIWRGLKEAKDVKALKDMTPQEYAESVGMPKYQSSEGVQKALGMLQTQARADLPGADVARQDYSRGLAMSLSAGKQAETPYGRMAVQGSALDRYNQNIERLGAQAAQYRAGQQANLASFYAGPVAQQEMNQFQYNEMLPFSTQMNEYWARRQGADAMIGGGFDSLMSGMTGAGSQASNQQTMQSWYPQQGAQAGAGGGMNPSWQPQVPTGYGGAGQLNNNVYQVYDPLSGQYVTKTG